MSVRDQRRAAVIVASTVLGALVALAVAAWSAWSYPGRARSPGDHRPVKLVVPKGMSAGAIARLLHERGLIDHPSWFRFYATERGDAQKVKPGQYAFAPAMSPKQLLDALVAGVPDEEVAI